MKHNAIIYLMVMLVAAGCSKENPAAEQLDTQQGEPLSFDVAEVVESQTRSGAAGSIDYSVLSKSGYGFGVIASQLGWTNQQVKYVPDAGTTNPGSAFFYPSKWRYWTSKSDIKYWLSDIHNKTASPIESVDFYAYAPYVASPSGSDGITAISGTNVSYAINTTVGAGVDLLWGVNGTTGKPWKGTTYTATGEGKQPTGGPVLFTFRHALAAIGFRVQSMIGKDNDLSDLDDESAIAGVLRSGGNYKVTIKKIELTGYFHPSGTLSLDNSKEDTPNWTYKTDAASQTLTVTNSQIVESMRHLHDKATTTGSSETIDTDDNPDNDSDAKKIMSDKTNNGVSQKANQQVVVNDGNGHEKYFLVIPCEETGTGHHHDFTVTLHWCVSAVLPDGNYVSEDHVNTINITDLKLIAGTKYLFNFIINLKLIGLEVTATDWRETSETTSVIIEHGTSASESLAREH